MGTAGLLGLGKLMSTHRSVGPELALDGLAWASG